MPFLFAFLFLVALLPARTAGANAGPSPAEFALLLAPAPNPDLRASVEPTLGSRVTLDISMGASAWWWAAMPTAVVFKVPSAGLELRLYYRQDEFLGGFAGLVFDASYHLVLPHPSWVSSSWGLAPGWQFGYRYPLGTHLSFEIVAILQALFLQYEDHSGNTGFEYGFGPSVLIGLRFVVHPFGRPTGAGRTPIPETDFPS